MRVEKKAGRRHPLWKVGEFWTCVRGAGGKPGAGARCSCTKPFQRRRAPRPGLSAVLRDGSPKWSRARVCCHGNRLSRGATQHHSVIHICVAPRPPPQLSLCPRAPLFLSVNGKPPVSDATLKLSSWKKGEEPFFWGLPPPQVLSPASWAAACSLAEGGRSWRDGSLQGGWEPSLPPGRVSPLKAQEWARRFYKPLGPQVGGPGGWTGARQVR